MNKMENEFIILEKLSKLLQNCKCGIYLHINVHRNYYETVEQYFRDNPRIEKDLDNIDSDVYEKMKETNTIIELQYYPNTPIRFYKVYHYDLEKAIDEALASLNVA